MTFQTLQNDEDNRDKNSPEGLSDEICSIWQGRQDSNQSKLSYRGKQKQRTSSRSSLLLRKLSWQGQQGSNLRHPVLETGALPTELCPCIMRYYTIRIVIC